MLRLPDFLIVGAMKSGTTSLHEWLAAQPELWMLPAKEPHFFSVNALWAKGVDSYASMFAAAPSHLLAAESSTSYTDPERGVPAAERIAATLPNAKLIYVVRHPLERLRSDLEHQLRQGHETRPAEVAIADPAAGHVLRSRYHACIAPYLERFASDRVCIVRFEDLVSPESTGWHDIVRFLDLADRPCPGSAHNVGEAQPDAGWLMGWLRARRWGYRVRSLPSPLRAVVKRVAGRPRRPLRIPPVPADVAALVWDDVAKLEAVLGRGRLWARSDD